MSEDSSSCSKDRSSDDEIFQQGECTCKVRKGCAKRAKKPKGKKCKYQYMCRCTQDISELPDTRTKKDKGKKKGRKLKGATAFLN